MFGFCFFRHAFAPFSSFFASNFDEVFVSGRPKNNYVLRAPLGLNSPLTTTSRLLNRLGPTWEIELSTFPKGTMTRYYSGIRIKEFAAFRNFRFSDKGVMHMPKTFGYFL